MARVIDRVMNMVREELTKRPDVTTRELFDRAKKMEPSMRSMTIRQFNATYPLQVKRSQMPRSRRGGRPAGSRRAADRERVRAVLLDLAREVAAADDKGRLVEVVGGMDRWVDRVLGMGTRQRAEVPSAELPSTDGGGPTVKRAGPRKRRRVARR